MTRTYDPNLDDVHVNRDGTIRWDGEPIGYVWQGITPGSKWRAELGDVARPDAWPGYRVCYADTRREAVAGALEGVEAPE